MAPAVAPPSTLRANGRKVQVLREGAMRLATEGRTVEVKACLRRHVDPQTLAPQPAVVDVQGRVHDLGGWTPTLLEEALCDLSDGEVAALLADGPGLLLEGEDGRPDVRCTLLARAAALTVLR